MNATAIDLALAGLLVFVTFTGWARGLLVSTSTLAGTVGGLFAARIVLAQLPNPLNPPSLSRIGVYVFVGFLTVAGCTALGGAFGRRLRQVLRWRPVRSVDNTAGALFSLTAWSVVVWIGASALIATPIKGVPDLVGSSRIVAYLDTYMPAPVRLGVERLRTAVTETQLPTTITAALTGPIVELPDGTVTKSKAVLGAVQSVVRVEGTSSSCAMRMTGTGFVAAPGLVVTNAHVVAGTDHVGVRVKGVGKQYKARVIYWDKKMDVAVLSVTGLKVTPVEIGVEAKRGTGAVIAGFPGGGSLKLVPAGVRSSSTAGGTDIYGLTPVKRRIYALLSDIKQGDSGAPVIGLDGKVIGMVFASSATDSKLGYALTPNAFQGIATLDAAAKSVSTGACISE